MAARAEAVAASGERMLASAWRQFSQGPYEQVRLTDIAAGARVTVQTLHARFGTKEDLFVAAWRWYMAPEGARRDRVPVGDVRAAVHALYDGYERDGRAVLRLMAAEERIPAVREMIDSGRVWHRDWVRRTFAPLLDDLPRAARERRLTQLVLATDLLAWKLLVLDMELDRGAAERIVTEMITVMKGAP
jgi:AcrR family transcriptional regulator